MIKTLVIIILIMLAVVLGLFIIGTIGCVAIWCSMLIDILKKIKENK